jgi:hypothetical protein
LLLFSMPVEIVITSIYVRVCPVALIIPILSLSMSMLRHKPHL